MFPCLSLMIHCLWLTPVAFLRGAKRFFRKGRAWMDNSLFLFFFPLYIHIAGTLYDVWLIAGVAEACPEAASATTIAAAPSGEYIHSLHHQIVHLLVALNRTLKVYLDVYYLIDHFGRITLLCNTLMSYFKRLYVECSNLPIPLTENIVSFF